MELGYNQLIADLNNVKDLVSKGKLEDALKLFRTIAEKDPREQWLPSGTAHESIALSGAHSDIPKIPDEADRKREKDKIRAQLISSIENGLKSADSTFADQLKTLEVFRPSGNDLHIFSKRNPDQRHMEVSSKLLLRDLQDLDRLRNEKDELLKRHEQNSLNAANLSRENEKFIEQTKELNQQIEQQFSVCKKSHVIYSSNGWFA